MSAKEAITIMFYASRHYFHLWHALHVLLILNRHCYTVGIVCGGQTADFAVVCTTVAGGCVLSEHDVVGNVTEAGNWS